MLVPSLARAGETAPAIRPVPSHPIDRPIAPRAALDRGAKLILKAERPLVMLGVTASRPHLADSLSYFVKHLQIPFFNTQMGKHSVAGGLYMAALSERDYVHWVITLLGGVATYASCPKRNATKIQQTLASGRLRP
jgi:acetolactate synthase I/II/III large subunit